MLAERDLNQDPPRKPFGKPFTASRSKQSTGFARTTFSRSPRSTAPLSDATARRVGVVGSSLNSAWGDQPTREISPIQPPSHLSGQLSEDISYSRLPTYRSSLAGHSPPPKSPLPSSQKQSSRTLTPWRQSLEVTVSRAESSPLLVNAAEGTISDQRNPDGGAASRSRSRSAETGQVLAQLRVRVRQLEKENERLRRERQTEQRSLLRQTGTTARALDSIETGRRSEQQSVSRSPPRRKAGTQPRGTSLSTSPPPLHTAESPAACQEREQPLHLALAEAHHQLERERDSNRYLQHRLCRLQRACDALLLEPELGAAVWQHALPGLADRDDYTDGSESDCSGDNREKESEPLRCMECCCARHHHLQCCACGTTAVAPRCLVSQGTSPIRVRGSPPRAAPVHGHSLLSSSETPSLAFLRRDRSDDPVAPPSETRHAGGFLLRGAARREGGRQLPQPAPPSTEWSHEDVSLSPQDSPTVKSESQRSVSDPTRLDTMMAPPSTVRTATTTSMPPYASSSIRQFSQFYDPFRSTDRTAAPLCEAEVANDCPVQPDARVEESAAPRPLGALSVPTSKAVLGWTALPPRSAAPLPKARHGSLETTPQSLTVAPTSASLLLSDGSRRLEELVRARLVALQQGQAEAMENSSSEERDDRLRNINIDFGVSPKFLEESDETPHRGRFATTGFLLHPH